MSKLVKSKQFDELVELQNIYDKRIGVFQTLDCEMHSTSWHFTDETGSDNCFECIKDMCEPKIEYTMPGFENLEESLDKLTIRRNLTQGE